MVSSPQLVRRREWLSGLFVGGATVLLGFDWLNSADCTGIPGTQDALLGGKHLGNLSFLHEPQLPLGSVTGGGLDGRLYADLASLSPEQGVIPTPKFYVRTRASDLLPGP